MYKKLFTTFALLTAGVLSANQLISVGTTDKAPKIDGKLNDACYKQTLPMAGFVNVKSLDYAKEQTEVRFVRDEKYLYCAIKAFQKNVAALPKLTPTQNNTNLWKYDSIEMFFLRGNMLRQYMFDYSGSSCVLDAYQNDRHTWDSTLFASKVKVAAGRGKNYWALELAIPLAELGKGDIKFNIVRNHNRKGHSSWARLEEINWRATEKYITLQMVDKVPGLSFAVLPELKLKSQLRFNIKSAKAVNVKFDAAGRIFNKSIADGVVEFKYDLPADKKSTNLVITCPQGKKLYDYTYAQPRGTLSIKPGNLTNNTIILDRGLQLESRIIWRSKHNLPNATRGQGHRVKIDNEIVFELPEGITLNKGKKVGEKIVDGKKVYTWVQKERYAHNASGWIKSFFTTTLPDNATGSIRYQLRWKDGVQPWGEVNYKVVTVKPAPLPKKFISSFYNFWPSLAQAKSLSRIGVNTFAVRGYAQSDIDRSLALNKAGFYVSRAGYFWPSGAKHAGSRTYDKWTRAERSARARDIGGFYIPNGDSFLISPTYRGKQYIDAINMEIEFCKKANINYFPFDMEGYIQSAGEKGDFSLRTLELFKKHFTAKYPDKKYIDPKVFERDPKKYSFYHTAWVEFKCDQWADFFAEMKKRFAEGLGKDCKSSPRDGVFFTEWSFRRPWTEEGRNHCLRNGNFFKVFDTIELDIYTSMDRGVRETQEKLDNFAKTFPDVKVDIILTPCPHALGGYHYGSAAPLYKDDYKYACMEAFSWGMKGIIGWHYGLADVDTMRQTSEAMNILAKIEDIVMLGTPFKLTTNLKNINVTDNFYGKRATWKNQPPVFTRGVAYKDKAIISVSEYLTGKAMQVTVNYAPGKAVTLKDLETDQVVATMKATDKSFTIQLEPERRCKLLLVEPVK